MKSYRNLVVCLVLLSLVVGCKKSDPDMEPYVYYTHGIDANSFFATIDGVDYGFVEYQDDVSGSVGSNKDLNVGSYSTVTYNSGIYYYESDENIYVNSLA